MVDALEQLGPEAPKAGRMLDRKCRSWHQHLAASELEGEVADAVQQHLVPPLEAFLDQRFLRSAPGDSLDQIGDVYNVKSRSP